MSPQPTQWRVPAETDLLWRVWGEEFLVYHVQSGNTHLLNPIAAEALRCIQAQGAGTDARQLAAQVAAQLALNGAQDLTAHMSELLQAFDESGLIERVANAG